MRQIGQFRSSRTIPCSCVEDIISATTTPQGRNRANRPGATTRLSGSSAKRYARFLCTSISYNLLIASHLRRGTIATRTYSSIKSKLMAGLLSSKRSGKGNDQDRFRFSRCGLLAQRLRCASQASITFRCLRIRPKPHWENANRTLVPDTKRVKLDSLSPRIQSRLLALKA